MMDGFPSLVHNDSIVEEEEGEEEEEEEDYDYQDEGFGNDGCSWFPFLCVGRKRYQNISTEGASQLQAQGENRENLSLWRRKLKELKEKTELLFGPKWKNFIRKLSAYGNKIKENKRRRTTTMVQFQYDPESYALNFDHGRDEAEHNLPRRDFSSRFAAPPFKVNSGRSCVGSRFPSPDS